MLNQDPSISLDAFDLYGSAGLYTLVWPHLQLQADLSRFKVNSDYELKAEVTFSSTRPNSPGHLRRRRVNLSNPDPRFIKSLREKDTSIDWADIIEQMAVAVCDLYRVGSPEVEMLGQIPATPEGHWLIKPLVHVGHPTLIYGTGATGKSWFSQYLSVLVHYGMDSSGLEIGNPTPVLYLDWETDEHEIGSRLAMIKKGLSLPQHSETGVFYKSMTQGLVADIAEVSAIIHRRHIGFVVLDSLGAACAGEPESAEVVLSLFGAIRSLRDSNGQTLATLCIDHTNKSDELFGSVFKERRSRIIFKVKKSQRIQEEEFEFALFHEKANNEKMIQPMGWNLEFDNNSGAAIFTRRDVKQSRLEVEMSIRDRIRNYLEESRHPASVADIAELLGKPSSHIAKELSQNKDMFTMVTKGCWTVIKSQEQEWAAQSVEIPAPSVPVAKDGDEELVQYEAFEL